MVKKLKSKANAVIIKEESDDSNDSEQKPVKASKASSGKVKKERTMTFTEDLPNDLSSDDDQPGNDAPGYGDEDYDNEDGSDDDEGEDDDDDSDGDDDGGLLSGEDCVEVPQDEAENKPVTTEDKEARRKKKRLEKLEKAIKKLQKVQDKKGHRLKSGKFEREASEIKNKHKRQEVVLRRRMAEREAKKLVNLQNKKTREEHGEDAAPKGKTNTIESMRVPDETMMEDNNDEDIIGEQNIDEFDSYFNRETTPKILITTNRRPKGKIF
jgi:hypothetical protein